MNCRYTYQRPACVCARLSGRQWDKEGAGASSWHAECMSSGPGGIQVYSWHPVVPVPIRGHLPSVCCVCKPQCLLWMRSWGCPAQPSSASLLAVTCILSPAWAGISSKPVVFPNLDLSATISSLLQQCLLLLSPCRLRARRRGQPAQQSCAIRQSRSAGTQCHRECACGAQHSRLTGKMKVEQEEIQFYYGLRFHLALNHSH